MLRRMLAILIFPAFALSLLAGPDTSVALPKLSATSIVDKNVAARGGLQAWRAVQTLTLTGKLGAGGNQRATLSVPAPEGHKAQRAVMPQRPVEEVQLPFVMELKRPSKVRFELQFKGQTAIQVFDGTLIDYAAKGTQVESDGTEKVEGRDTYKLKLTFKSGDVTHVWVDSQTFLEAKVQGRPRRLDGTDHPVEVYYRDYRPVNGLQIPFVLETRVLPVAKTATGLRDTPVPSEKIVIEKVTVNPKLDDSQFAKPQTETAAAKGK